MYNITYTMKSVYSRYDDTIKEEYNGVVQRNWEDNGKKEKK